MDDIKAGERNKMDRTPVQNPLFSYLWPYDEIDDSEPCCINLDVIELLGSSFPLPKENRDLRGKELDYVIEQKDRLSTSANNSNHVDTEKSEDNLYLKQDKDCLKSALVFSLVDIINELRAQNHPTLSASEQACECLRRGNEEKRKHDIRRKQATYKKSVATCAQFNSIMQESRKHYRRYYYDLSTQIIQNPVLKHRKLSPKFTKPSDYPVALLPGQFSENYKIYSANDLNYLPLNSVIFGPVRQKMTLDDLRNYVDDTCVDGNSFEDVEEATVEIERKIDYCGICGNSEDKNKRGVTEKMIYCSQCDNAGHPSCLDIGEALVKVILTYPWQCMECKVCVVCGDEQNEDKIMFCDKCDRGFHSYCIGLESIPIGSWVCDLCVECGSCGTPKPGDDESAKWRHEYSEGKQTRLIVTYCAKCSELFEEGQFCPVCLKVYEESQPESMIQCRGCGHYVHRRCETLKEDKLSKASNPRSRYKCGVCRREATDWFGLTEV